MKLVDLYSIILTALKCTFEMKMIDRLASASVALGLLSLFVLPILAEPQENALSQEQARPSLKSGGPRPDRFPDAGEKPIANWTGPVFSLSQNYPIRKPAAEDQPWKKYDFYKEAEWKDYLNSVLHYCMEGNVEVDWATSSTTGPSGPKSLSKGSWNSSRPSNEK
jgi:hypothetical protein